MKKVKRAHKTLRLLIFALLCLTVISPSALAAEHKTLEINATLVTSGPLPETPEQSSMILSADDIGQPMPQGAVQGKFTLNISGSGTYQFPKITYDKVGTYQYTICQFQGSDPECKYDPISYKLKVLVSYAQAGGLDITTLVYKKGDAEKSPQIIFFNSYAAPAKIKFKAFKTMDGKTPKAEHFIFQLTDAKGKLLQSKPNIGQVVEFEEVLLKQTGMHVFMIREKKGSNPHILYDESVFTAKVSVIKNDRGDYEASVSYEKCGKPVNGVPTFENKTAKELPYTGTSRTALPMLGTIMVLCGITVAIRRKLI